MTNPRRPWSTTTWFVLAAQLLGISETAGGLSLIVIRHDGGQGYALLAIGAATFGSTPWASQARSD
jgi:hypothetical protein